MCAQAVELDKELFVEFHPALWVQIDFRHPALNAIGIKLLVPRGVERVGKVAALAVATDLDHLRTAVESHARLVRVGGAANNPTEVDRTGFLRVGGIGDVVSYELACPPAGNIEEAVVEREIDVGY